MLLGSISAICRGDGKIAGKHAFFSKALCALLRHTAATWLMQKGADPWQAAGYLGMSLEVLLNTYGHHHPDYLSDAVEKIAMREPGHERKAHVSGAVSGAVIPLRRNNP